MLFSYDFTIPAATPATTKYTEVIRLDTGTLREVKIRFRSGCHNRVYFVLYDGLQQIIPAHDTTALYADDYTFSIPMNYLIPNKPYILTPTGWSPSTRYDHTITLWLDLQETAQDRKQGPIDSLLHLLSGGG